MRISFHTLLNWTLFTIIIIQVFLLARGVYRYTQAVEESKAIDRALVLIQGQKRDIEDKLQEIAIERNIIFDHLSYTKYCNISPTVDKYRYTKNSQEHSE